MNVSMVISAFHKGRMGVRVCVIKNYNASNPANELAQLTEECLDKNILVSEGPGKACYWRLWVLRLENCQALLLGMVGALQVVKRQSRRRGDCRMCLHVLKG